MKMAVNNFSSCPVITTRLLTLRQLTSDDAQKIFALRSDPEINKYLERTPARVFDDAIRFINMVNDNIKNCNSLYWAVTLSDSNSFAGTICLFDFSVENRSCEIGYELLVNFQGRGIMQEAVEAVINFAFNRLQIRQLVAVVHHQNAGSNKLLERFHFLPSQHTENEQSDYKAFTLVRPI